MKIPRDLEPGDRLWYSKTEYATVRNRIDNDTPYLGGRIAAKTKDGDRLIYHAHGEEWSNDTPPVIHIERITSKAKPAKVKPDQDAAWLRTWCEGDWLTRYAVRRLRAIARRLQGAGS